MCNFLLFYFLRLLVMYRTSVKHSFKPLAWTAHIGRIQRRLAWPLLEDDMQIHEPFHVKNMCMSFQVFVPCDMKTGALQSLAMDEML